MLLTNEAKKKAHLTLLGLAALGAQWVNEDGPVAYLSIETMPRLGGAKALEFARLIRQAGVLERSGALIPNADRMGQIVGWHLTQRAATPIPVAR